ncbi:hypothetical protein NKR23_g9138 [Pleurostoma richardsiae]|uniref:DUF6536 domain-containing protein n=1 Tax=Pleurostoma richardsiae TaxID=41990 RepID=A0AA38VCF4_9PEZI|nr:hypothetical protein NKR23_g9138 [Pleurostoma richardsiae]
MSSGSRIIHLGTGWRKAANINTIVLSSFLAILVIVFAVSAKKGGGVEKAWMFYDGNCKMSVWLNVSLHLLLNIISTAILASSSFFTQVINSPTREDIDIFHAQRKWLHIGVPSFRNLFLLSRRRAVVWFLFMLSSVPISVVLNSAVFEVEEAGSTFFLSIAAADFVHGGSVFPPGASLVAAGSTGGSGSHVDYGEYSNSNSQIVQNITKTATAGSSWEKLPPAECRAEFVECGGLRRHRNVILIINTDGDQSTRGWNRSEVWPVGQATDSFDDIVPSNETNTLWFAAECAVNAGLLRTCGNTCGNVLGLKDGVFDSRTDAHPSRSWLYSFFEGVTYDNEIAGQSYSFGDISVRYCLAEKIEEHCKVGLSNQVLLIVIVCVSLKVGLCYAVMILMTRRTPLVTPGDAIASFISVPDSSTVGMSFMDRWEVDMWSRNDYERLAIRQWKTKNYRQGNTASFTSWAIFVASVAIINTFLIIIYAWEFTANGSKLFADDLGFNSLHDWFPGPTRGQFLPSVIMANAAQLLLSFAYLVYNSFITKFLAGQEWARMSRGYNSLRVTHPQGEQKSTYRLQLPYSYSIPMITISILLHWIMSRTFYILISEGGYFNAQDLELYDYRQDPSLGLADNAKEEIDLERVLLKGDSESSILLGVSRRRIKWGIVNMSKDFYSRFDEAKDIIGHLSFGVEEDGVRQPIDGALYS